MRKIINLSNLVPHTIACERGRTAIVVLLLIFLGGCMSLKQPSLRVDYYTLDYEAQMKNADHVKTLPVILKLRQFSAAPLYDTNKLIYRDKKYRRSSYNYHRWRANPADLVTYYLRRDLQAGHLFSAVLPPLSMTSPTYVIEGIIDEFLEDDEAGNWFAKLAVTITLKRNREIDVSKEVIFQKSFSYRMKCVDKKPASVAESMSQAMAKFSADVNSAIYQALSE